MVAILNELAVSKGAEVLFDEFNPGEKLTEGDHDVYRERFKIALLAYFVAAGGPSARLLDALEKIASGGASGPRCHVIARNALGSGWPWRE